MLAAESGESNSPTLTQLTLADGRTAIYDEYGIGHVLGTEPDNEAAGLAFQTLNDDLKAAGVFSDGSRNGTGEQFLLQSDANPLVGKGSFRDKNGKLRFNGTTTDFIRVSYDNGRIVDVNDFDATSARDGKSLKLVAGDINGKMDPAKKAQANNVIYVATSADQAKMVASHFADDPRVRVLHPESGFDTGPVFDGATGGADMTRVSPKIGGRIFGVAGLLMPFAQSNSYMRSFGFWGGLREMGKNFFDPFGVADSVTPPGNSGSICDPSSGNCA
jgi:hypothetical protein